MASEAWPIRCELCGHKLKDADRECPLCGTEVKFKSESETQAKQTSPFVKTIVWTAVGAVLAGVVIAEVAGYIFARSQEEKRQFAEAVSVAKMSQQKNDAEVLKRAVVVGTGAKTFAEACTHCHTKDYLPLDKMQLTKEQWKEAIEHMVRHGPKVPDAEMPDLLDHLVGMNPAPAGPDTQ